MIRNYLKIAFRTLWNNKLFSFVNIFGLALSMSVGIKLIANIKNNFDTDHFHPHIERTFRLLTTEQTTQRQQIWASTPMPLSKMLPQLSSIKKIVNVRNGGMSTIVTKNGGVTAEVTYSEPTFFDVFGFKLENGIPNSLNEPTNIFVSEKMAQTLFGDADAIGKSVVFETLGTFTVAGIIQNPPLETHLPIDVMLSLEAANALEKKGILPDVNTNWKEFKTSTTYVELQSPEDLSVLNKSLAFNNRVVDKTKLQFSAQPIEDITPWNPEIVNDMHPGMNWTGILTDLLLAIGLTVLAAFNYTSLSLARALARAREVGIRKSSGATRSQIILQFLMEAILTALLSLGLSIILLNLLGNLGVFSIQKIEPQLFLWLLLYSILTGIVAGTIPAWLLSAFQPLHILKNLKNAPLLRGVNIYKVLIVIQFSVATAAVVTFVILRDFGTNYQHQYIDTLPNNILILDLREQSYQTIKPQIEQISKVKKVIPADWLPVFPPNILCTLKTAKINQVIRAVNIDTSFISMFETKFLAGQGFPKDIPQKSEQFVILNEAAAKSINPNLKATIGQIIKVDSVDLQIVGVISSDEMHEVNGRVIPCLFRYLPNKMTRLAIQIEPNSEKVVTTACRKIWQNNYPAKLSEIYPYKLLAGDLNNFKSFSNTIGSFCLLILFIASLGILGISAYSVEVRAKEVAVRQVLGANMSQLIWVMTKEFVKYLAWAGALGLPVGWFLGKLLHDRLGDAVDFGAKNLTIGFAVVVVVGLLTTLSQTLRAGRNNPSNILRGQ